MIEFFNSMPNNDQWVVDLSEVKQAGHLQFL